MNVLRAYTTNGCRRTRDVQRMGVRSLGKNLLNLEMTQIVGIAYLSEAHDHGRK